MQTARRASHTFRTATFGARSALRRFVARAQRLRPAQLVALFVLCCVVTTWIYAQMVTRTVLRPICTRLFAKYGMIPRDGSHTSLSLGAIYDAAPGAVSQVSTLPVTTLDMPNPEAALLLASIRKSNNVLTFELGAIAQAIASRARSVTSVEQPPCSARGGVKVVCGAGLTNGSMYDMAIVNGAEDAFKALPHLYSGALVGVPSFFENASENSRLTRNEAFDELARVRARHPPRSYGLLVLRVTGRKSMPYVVNATDGDDFRWVQRPDQGAFDYYAMAARFSRSSAYMRFAMDAIVAPFMFFAWLTIRCITNTVFLPMLMATRHYADDALVVRSPRLGYCSA